MWSSDKQPRKRRWRARSSSLARGLGFFPTEETSAADVDGAMASARGPARLVSQTEIQQDLQRFAGEFSERVTQATQPLIAQPHGGDLYEPALRHTLLALSAALEIAAGPRPEVNLLDMVVFVTLSRDVLDRHYVPHVLGARGMPLAQAFATSEAQIWELARKVLSPAQEERLQESIRNWQAAHPDQTRVAGVRFTEFSALAADDGARRAASGLLSSVQSVTRTADEALLLGERAMFLAPRIPFVLRLQARLGMHEILTDSLSELDRVEDLLQRTAELRPMLGELAQVVEQTRVLAVDAQRTSAAAQKLSESALPLLQGAERLLSASASKDGRENRVQKLVASSDRLVVQTRGLVQDLHDMTEGDPMTALRTATDRLEALSKRMLWQGAAVGAGLIALFWAAYFLATRAW